ncbi:MAG: hypothetical protein ACTSVU_04715 [Promethearchaeota archaeon]
MATPNFENEKKLDSLEKKINKFSEILEQFGLNLIQSIGGMKHQLGVLSEKVDKIEKELIELKGIRSQLAETTKIRQKVHDDLYNLQSDLKLFMTKERNNEHLLNSSVEPPSNIKTPIEIFNYLEDSLKSVSSIGKLANLLKSTREELYLITGGHKISFELTTIERKVKNSQDVNVEEFRDQLFPKIQVWKKEFET